MGNQWAKFESDHPASHHIRASKLRKRLSWVDQPLKKINNDKGDIRIQNHANAIHLLQNRGFMQKYMKDCTTLYDIDIVETRNDPSSSHMTRCVDYARCPMPSQLTVTMDTLQKLNSYFKANQSIVDRSKSTFSPTFAMRKLGERGGTSKSMLAKSVNNSFRSNTE